jgi:hypothetical protein
MLLSFTSLAKVFIQRGSHESCDVLYISQERGWVGGHGDFSSSAVVVTRECGVALKLSISIGNMALQFQFSLASKKGRLGAVGEKLTHRAPGPGFEAASLHICGGKACFGYPFPRTPLKWEPPGTGSALFTH